MSLIGVALIFAYLFITESKAPDISSALNETQNFEHSLISVIITAKNEEEVIERCIISLQKQTYSNLEIILVDDSSSDLTVEVGEKLEKQDSRIHVVKAGPKPPGWLGKSWPCEAGHKASKGETMLFVDADSVFDPMTVELTSKRSETGHLDIYSISPQIELRGLWAHAVMPLLSSTINLLYPMIKVNDPSSDRAYVFGTFILVRRSVYEAIGGHERVRDTLVEDAALGKNAKTGGYKLRVEKGNDLIRTEWEKDFSPIYRGLERIFSDSIKSYGPVSVLNAALMFFLGIYPICFAIGYCIAFGSASNSFVLSAGFAASLLAIVLVLLLASLELKHLTGKIGLYPLAYPVGFILYISAIITTSAKIFVTGSFRWKDEKYKIQN